MHFRKWLAALMVFSAAVIAASYTVMFQRPGIPIAA